VIVLPGSSDVEGEAEGQKEIASSRRHPPALLILPVLTNNILFPARGGKARGTGAERAAGKITVDAVLDEEVESRMSACDRRSTVCRLCTSRVTRVLGQQDLSHTKKTLY
jgi:hypothetical protein